ncbi:sugar transporter [Novosphingobium flavum]|uniref:Sugar transporter n=1 Tax=Novosphingobium flavum TaxID=1778672 RepID=A0A7X1KME4_9SPHN|nr:sugar transporter [Novosphingobium flavum]MBC2666537.1 sugar transporter [Novosphingobium flavum]
MTRFRMISLAFLVWNLTGDGAYLAQSSADLDALARTDPITADAFRAMPWWAWSAYAAAVWGGTAAAIALLMRRRLAVPLFALALVAVVIQFGWTFLGYGLIAKKGIGTVAFPLVIAVIGLAELAYARARRADGTLR